MNLCPDCSSDVRYCGHDSTGDTSDAPEMTAADLLAHKVSQKTLDAAEALAERAQYTTAALEALARFHSNNGDTAGADMLRGFAAQFAAYEITTL